MKKLIVLVLALVCVLGLVGCKNEHTEDMTNTNRFLPNTQKVQVVFYSGSDVHEWELAQDEIEDWTNWLNGLTLEQVSFERGTAPETTHTSGTRYIFNVNGEEVQMQYIDEGADGVYLFVNELWYKINNPTEPFNKY